MVNRKSTSWAITVCEDTTETREFVEVDGKNHALLKRGIRRYAQPIEDNSLKPAASLKIEELESLRKNLAPDKPKTTFDIGLEFRTLADKLYENNGLPFGYKSYFYKNEGVCKIEFYPFDSENYEKFKEYSDIPAHNIVKLLNFPLSSPLYLAAKLHELAFDIEYYATLKPTPFVQSALLEIGIEAGKIERDLNDELTPHFDTMVMNKGKGRTAKALFDNGLSNNRSRRKGGLNRGNAIIKDSKVHHEIILKVFEKHGKEARFKNKIKTGEFIIKHLPKHQERRDPRRVYEILEKFYTFDFKTKKWSKTVM